jgi:hypothetical protein
LEPPPKIQCRYLHGPPLRIAALVYRLCRRCAGQRCAPSNRY